MVFPGFVAPLSGPSHVEQGAIIQPGSMDSISMGQLKSIAPPPPPKPKQCFYDFRYDDQDTLLNELEEFYSYAEVSQIDENLRTWQNTFQGDWIPVSAAEKKVRVVTFLEGLEHKDAHVRFQSGRQLLYLLQGVFVEATSSEHQLFWIMENCKIFRAANGLSAARDALRVANAKHDLLHSWSDQESNHLPISQSEKVELLEEVCTEISLYLGMMYHVIEVTKGDDEFAEELMTFEPPLPVFLFNIVAGLKDKSPKGYPVKKLVLTLWKTLLACYGGLRELASVKALARELANLPELREAQPTVKSTPSDIDVFRQETAIKYPSFAIPAATDDSGQISKTLNHQLAQADMPIPTRLHYHNQEHQGSLSHPSPHVTLQSQAAPGSFHNRPAALPATPAPTPPPSPASKPKKQQYQTDQSRPFLFPFARPKKGTDVFVPHAIDEADQLYGRHMHLSAALWQTWSIREAVMREEAGLNSRESENDMFSESKMIDERLSRTEKAIKDASKAGDRTRFAKAKELKEDLLRLRRVEQLYHALLPNMSACVTQLLKMLLAIVSAASGSVQHPQSTTSSNFPTAPSAPEPAPPPPPLTVEDMDVVRHREVASKAVSAILLLTLKWFKASHVMKFQHLGLLLLDSNCLLLILKMFGLQEVSTLITSKCESPDHKYCNLHHSRAPQQAHAEGGLGSSNQRQAVSRIHVYPNGQRVEEEIELLTDFSWRNLFTSINYIRIMQKLTKRRSHRIWLLVQYKSSAILKRILKVPHSMLQLHVLKLIKSQVPYCGRKWRQSNMKVITQIYMNCRPDLRDEWLTGSEIEDLNEVVSQEQALRSLVKYYNTKRYGNLALHNFGQSHKRSASVSVPGNEGLNIGPELASLHRQTGTPNVDLDVFPPLRSHAAGSSAFTPYIPEDIAFEEEYEDYLSDLGISDDQSHTRDQGYSQVDFGHAAWSRLASLPNVADNISDSESVISIGELGEEIRSEERDFRDENRNDWEHMSPKTMAALPKSPAGGNRRSSSGSHLRPVIPFNLDEGSAIDDDDLAMDEPEMGPMPREGASFAAAEGGKGVDEVEFLYNE